jgi:signal transduction histidine kinase
MFKNSIQKRLGLWLIFLLLISGIILAQLSVFLMDQGMRRYLQSHLQNEAQTLLSALVRTPQAIELDQQRISAIYQRPFSGKYFLIKMPEQEWRSRSLWDFQLDLPETDGLQKKLADGPQAQELLTYSIEFRRYGKSIRIITAQDYTPMLQAFRLVQLTGVLIGLLVLVILVFLQGYLVKRAFRPLEEVRKQIIQLQEGERNLLDTRVPDELLPLVQQINHLLQHTENTLHQSRTALGNLGHALKTPLAVLFSLQNRAELQSHPEIKKDLLQQLQQMQERISHELTRARLGGEALPGSYFDCEVEVADLCETLQQIHGEDLNLHWSVTKNLKLPWDREDMLELLGNLLDNACKWAKKQVQLDIKPVDSFYQITIDDDGPGIAEEFREQVLQRGMRIDEQVQGHGLGLGIVKDIVDHCRGELLLETSPLQGLRVIVKLPLKR